MQLMVELIGVELKLSEVQKSLSSNIYNSNDNKSVPSLHTTCECCLWLPQFQLCVLPIAWWPAACICPDHEVSFQIFFSCSFIKHYMQGTPLVLPATRKVSNINYSLPFKIVFYIGCTMYIKLYITCILYYNI